MKKIALIITAFLFFGCASKTATTSSTETTTYSSVDFSQASFAEAQALSSSSDKNIFLEVSTSWCGYCKKMKKKVYTDKEVINQLAGNYVNMGIDAEVGEGITLAQKYGVTMFPTQLILDSKGKVLKKNVGYLTAAQLIAFTK